MHNDETISKLNRLIEEVTGAGNDLAKRRSHLAAMLREIVVAMTDDRTKPVTPPLTDERPDPMGLNKLRETSQPPKPKKQPRSPVPDVFHSILAVLVDVMTSWEIKSEYKAQQLEAEKLAKQIEPFVKTQSKNLEGQIQDLREQANQLRNANKDVKTYEQEIASLQDGSRKQADVCEKLRTERDQLRQALSKAEEEAAQIEFEVKEAKRRLKSLKSKRAPLSAIESEIEVFEKDLSDLDTRLKPLKEKKNELKQRLTQTQQLVETLSDYSLGHSPTARQITQIWNEIPSDEFDRLLQSSEIYSGNQR